MPAGRASASSGQNAARRVHRRRNAPTSRPGTSRPHSSHRHLEQGPQVPPAVTPAFCSTPRPYSLDEMPRAASADLCDGFRPAPAPAKTCPGSTVSPCTSNRAPHHPPLLVCSGPDKPQLKDQITACRPLRPMPPAPPAPGFSPEHTLTSRQYRVDLLASCWGFSTRLVQGKAAARGLRASSGQNRVADRLWPRGDGNRISSCDDVERPILAQSAKLRPPPAPRSATCRTDSRPACFHDRSRPLARSWSDGLSLRPAGASSIAISAPAGCRDDRGRPGATSAAAAESCGCSSPPILSWPWRSARPAPFHWPHARLASSRKLARRRSPADDSQRPSPARASLTLKSPPLSDDGRALFRLCFPSNKPRRLAKPLARRLESSSQLVRSPPPRLCLGG